jgi:acyl carrier protein
MSDSSARLIQCFATVFPHIDVQYLPEASTASIAEWDSVAAITLAALIEEEFGIRIGADDMAELVSFAVIADYLGRTVAVKP